MWNCNFEYELRRESFRKWVNFNFVWEFFGKFYLVSSMVIINEGGEEFFRRSSSKCKDF